MKKISSWIAMVLAICMLLSASAFAAPSFTDVQPGDWFYDAVSYCVEQGMVNGMTPTTFAPQGTMTRAQFVTILGRMDGFDTKAYSGYAAFSDEGADTWYTPYINWAAKIGVTDGVTPTTFAPDANVTREQVATFTARYLTLKCLRLQDDAKPAPAFPDSGSISTWAKDAVESMRLAGLLRGNDKGLVQPGKNMTRAEGATFLMRLHQAMQKADGAHDWDTGTVQKQPTCTETGVMLYTCKRDPGHTRQESIPAAGHKPVMIPGTPATDTAPGKRDTWKCSVCGLLFLDEACTQPATDENVIIPIHEHVWQPVYETVSVPKYDMEQHELCDLCGSDLTQLDYQEAHDHLAGHDSSDPNYMKSHMEYVARENGALKTEQLVGYECELCGKTKDAEPGAEHVHDYVPVMYEVELPAFRSVTLRRCSACDMDCTNMTEEEWQEHFDAHMLKKDGEFAVRYNSVETVPDSTRKINVQIGWKCADCGSSTYFSMYAPQYEFSKSIETTAKLTGNICNADGCNALYSVGGYISPFGMIISEKMSFVTSAKARTDHSYAHALANENAGCHSFSNMEAVISYVHHRTFSEFTLI